jgi:hypothetical protein
MARKRGRPPKTEIQKKLDKISKTKLFERFSEKVVRAALEAGFVEKQIEKFENDETLKAALIRNRPGLAVRFIEKPEVRSREITYVDKECEFDVSILAGFGPIADHMRRESQEIDRMIRRKGISVFNIQSMTIERNMVASEDGRKHSKVLVKYRKEE